MFVVNVTKWDTLFAPAIFAQCSIELNQLTHCGVREKRKWCQWIKCQKVIPGIVSLKVIKISQQNAFTFATHRKIFEQVLKKCNSISWGSFHFFFLLHSWSLHTDGSLILWSIYGTRECRLSCIKCAPAINYWHLPACERTRPIQMDVLDARFMGFCKELPIRKATDERKLLPIPIIRGRYISVFICGIFPTIHYI